MTGQLGDRPQAISSWHLPRATLAALLLLSVGLLLTRVPPVQAQQSSGDSAAARIEAAEAETARLRDAAARVQRRLEAAEAALAAERAAHARTRAAALEALREAVAAASTAGIAVPSAANVGAVDGSSATRSEAETDASGASPGAAGGPDHAEPSTSAAGADLPLPAPAPFSNADSRPAVPEPVAASQGTGRPDAPGEEASVAASTATPPANPLAALESGRIAGKGYVIERLAEGHVISGRSGKCYNVELLNMATGKQFTFGDERYVLVEKDQQARDSYAAFYADVVQPLTATADPRLYLAAGASRKPFSRPRNISPTRRGLTSVTYFPRTVGSKLYADKTRTDTMPQRYTPRQLPLLRADSVRELLGRGGDVSRLQLLEGPLLASDTDPASQTFQLVMCLEDR